MCSAPVPLCGSEGKFIRLALQAVMYFRRALKLNPNYLSAWTLMGHEYVEMKNTPAAIGEAHFAVVLEMLALSFGDSMRCMAADCRLLNDDIDPAHLQRHTEERLTSAPATTGHGTAWARPTSCCTCPTMRFTTFDGEL